MESGIPADRHSSPGAPLIFIVSKDKELRKFLTGILMPEYNIETFPSPDSVFDKISQELPSLVISGMVFNDGKEGLKPLILGAGTNVLPPDEGLDTLVICLLGGLTELRRLNGDRIEAGAGGADVFPL